jgi:glycine betaine/proline transport system permease protein
MTADAVASTPRAIAVPRWIWFVVAVAGLVLANMALSGLGPFPETWNVGLAEAINELRVWLIQNNQTHPLFTFVFNPIRTVVDAGLSTVDAILAWTPWYALVAATFFLMVRARGIRAGLVAAVAMLYFGAVGLWDATLQTLSLIVVSVAISLIVGIPLGVWAARNRKVEKTLRPVLDAMQTLPAFVYLLPVVLLFGIQGVPAVVATAIYAIPPAIRLTTLGIRQVPAESVEASEVFGATPRQTLFKVEIPLAMPSIMAGVNQTLMMALGLVVIASLIGAAGLGLVVEQSLRTIDVGTGLEAGLAVVILAVLLDRISNGLATRKAAKAGDFRFLPQSWQSKDWARRFEARVDRTAIRLEALEKDIVRWTLRPWRDTVAARFLERNAAVVLGTLVVVVLAVVGRATDSIDFPDSISFSFAAAVDAMVIWARDNLRAFTAWFSDVLTLYGTRPLRALFDQAIVWPVLIAAVGLLAWWAASWKVAVFAVAGMLGLGLLGVWSPTMDTISQTVVAVALSLVIAIPLGLAAARSPRVERIMQPIYDTLQTIPTFVYLVPVMILFSVGRIPGIIASILYAIPPGARLTTLGIKQVPEQTVEASTMFGATPAQTMRKVQVPLAMPSMMAAANQVVMMVLAMVVIAGMVGGEGLGLLTVRGFRRQQETGLGFEAGIAIVILAMILDRITEGFARRTQPGPTPERTN